MNREGAESEREEEGVVDAKECDLHEVPLPSDGTGVTKGLLRPRHPCEAQNREEEILLVTDQLCLRLRHVLQHVFMPGEKRERVDIGVQRLRTCGASVWNRMVCVVLVLPPVHREALQPLLLLWLRCRLGHPLNYTFILSKLIFIGSRYPGLAAPSFWCKRLKLRGVCCACSSAREAL